MTRLTVVIEIDKASGPKALTVAKAIVDDVLYRGETSEYVSRSIRPGFGFTYEWVDDTTLLVKQDPVKRVTIEVPLREAAE